MVDLKALVPWRDKLHTPAPRDEHRDPFLAFRREVDRMFDDFFNGLGRREGSSPLGSWGMPTPSMDHPICSGRGSASTSALSKVWTQIQYRLEMHDVGSNSTSKRSWA